MKFIQFNSHMIPGPNGPIIGLFALGEDGFLYQYERHSETEQFWMRLSNKTKQERLDDYNRGYNDGERTQREFPRTEGA